MILNTQRIKELLKEDKRLDGRGLTDYRDPISLRGEISWTAEGSAEVTIGKTVVMAGVKLALEKPYNDTPDQGGIMVNVEFLPLSNPEFRPGPPTIDAVELARVTDRGIRESKAVDFKKLCVTPGEKAWFIIIDVVTINDDGNLFDAAGLAALAALKAAHFPEVDKDTGAINYKKKTAEKLPLLKNPIPITVHKVAGKILVDPTREEGLISQARLTVTTDSDGTISAIQKGGESAITIDEVSQMVDLALEKATFLREKLEGMHK